MHSVVSVNGWEGRPPVGDHMVVTSHGLNPRAGTPRRRTTSSAAWRRGSPRPGNSPGKRTAGEVGGHILAAGLVDEVAMDVVPVGLRVGQAPFRQRRRAASAGGSRRGHFVWVSSPGSRHSRNIVDRAAVAVTVSTPRWRWGGPRRPPSTPTPDECRRTRRRRPWGRSTRAFRRPSDSAATTCIPAVRWSPTGPACGVAGCWFEEATADFGNAVDMTTEI
jgi:hypothetical protein